MVLRFLEKECTLERGKLIAGPRAKAIEKVIVIFAK
jgi:hypothetical protein